MGFHRVPAPSEGPDGEAPSRRPQDAERDSGRPGDGVPVDGYAGGVRLIQDGLAAAEGVAGPGVWKKLWRHFLDWGYPVGRLSLEGVGVATRLPALDGAS